MVSWVNTVAMVIGVPAEVNQPSKVYPGRVGVGRPDPASHSQTKPFCSLLLFVLRSFHWPGQIARQLSSGPTAPELLGSPSAQLV